MTEFIPTPEAVEAAGNAIKNQWLSEGTHWLPNDCARAAIAAFVEAEGFTVEWTWMDDDGESLGPAVPLDTPATHERWCGPWRKRENDV